MNLFNYLAFVLLGIVNNTPYVVVISAAQTLATRFDCEAYVGIVTGCNIAAGVVAQLFNAFVLQPLNVPHAYRIMGTSATFVVGICGLAFTWNIFPRGMHAGFWVSIGFILVVGMATAFGGNVMLAYIGATFPTKKKVAHVPKKGEGQFLEGDEENESLLVLDDEDESQGEVMEQTEIDKKENPCFRFWCCCCIRRKNSKEEKKQREPSEFCIGGWSAGTGFAGILGTFTYLIFNSLNVVFLVRFIVFVPLVFVYLAVFGFGITELPGDEHPLSVIDAGEERQLSLNDDDLSDEIAVRDPGSGLLDEDPLLLTVQATEKNVREKDQRCQTFRQQLCLILKRTLYPALNILLIYWSEYTNSICFGERIFPSKESEKSKYWAVHNAYEIFVTCYGVGVVLSRSSLQIFKVPRCCLWVMTLIQFLSMGVWFSMAKWHYMSTPTLVWFLFPWMFFLGCLGGTCYVNTYYITVTDPHFSENEETEKAREMSINIISIATNLGIALSSATTVLLDNTVLKSKP